MYGSRTQYRQMCNQSRVRVHSTIVRQTVRSSSRLQRWFFFYNNEPIIIPKAYSGHHTLKSFKTANTEVSKKINSRFEVNTCNLLTCCYKGLINRSVLLCEFLLFLWYLNTKIVHKDRTLVVWFLPLSNLIGIRILHYSTCKTEPSRWRWRWRTCWSTRDSPLVDWWMATGIVIVHGPVSCKGRLQTVRTPARVNTQAQVDTDVIELCRWPLNAIYTTFKQCATENT